MERTEGRRKGVSAKNMAGPSVSLQLYTSGKRMHASLANTRQRPVETMLRMMIPVTNYFSKERPGTVYNIRDLFSSQSGFVVPDRCEAWLDVHLPPDAPDESVSFSQALQAGELYAGLALKLLSK